MKKDKHKERSGALFFLLTGIAVSAVVPSLFAFAGFLYCIPYLNIASAALISPLVCTLLCRIFSKKLRVAPLAARVLTAIPSVLGAYIFVCVLTGTLSGVFGALPLETELMNDVEMMEYIKRAGTVFGNAANYFLSPGLLWQDIAARGETMWAMIAAAALIAHFGLPQMFIRKQAGY